MKVKPYARGHIECPDIRNVHFFWIFFYLNASATVDRYTFHY